MAFGGARRYKTVVPPACDMHSKMRVISAILRPWLPMLRTAVVPFVIIIYFGLAVINYDSIAGLSGWPLVLPLDSLMSTLIVGALVFYIGQTMWLWWDWGKLQKPR